VQSVAQVALLRALRVVVVEQPGTVASEVQAPIPEQLPPRVEAVEVEALVEAVAGSGYTAKGLPVPPTAAAGAEELLHLVQEELHRAVHMAAAPAVVHRLPVVAVR